MMTQGFRITAWLLFAVSAMAVCGPVHAQRFSSDDVPPGEIILGKRYRHRPAPSLFESGRVVEEYKWGAVLQPMGGQQLYYHDVYLGTTIVTSTIPVERLGKRQYRAQGFAKFRSPDKRRVVYGEYRDGQPVGEWLSIEVGAEVPVLAFDYERPKTVAEATAQWQKHCTGPDQCRYWSIKYTPYVAGEIEGIVRSRPVRYPVFDSTEYRMGEREGLRITHDSTGRRQTVVVFADGEVVEEVYSLPGRSSLDSLPEEVPVFGSTDCPRSATDGLGRVALRECSEAALLRYVYGSVGYPRSERRLNVEGLTHVGFVVEEDGSISGVHTDRFTTANLDYEARRIVEVMPDWTPGRQDGVPVRVSFILPVQYKLE